MRSLIYLCIGVILCPFFVSGQYVETFDLANKGILSGTCSTNDPTSCTSYDFTLVDWTITGDLSGIDDEGFFTTGGYLLAEDLDEAACWQSPTLDISGAGTASMTVNFTIPAGATWENSTTPGSIDFMDVKYSVDGGSFVTVANQSGCPSSGHTISVSGCTNLSGPVSYAVNVTDISGNNMVIQVCIDTNTAGDDGHLEEVSVIGGTVLPVLWGDIQAEINNLECILSWSTKSEINSDKFEIQRLENDVFKTIGIVEASQYTTKETYYEYADQDLMKEDEVYYRICQVDLDGQMAFSRVVSVSLKSVVKEELMQIYPNPTSQRVYIGFDTQRIHNMGEILVHNSMGELIETKQIGLKDTSLPIQLDVSQFQAGVYLIQLVDKSGRIILDQSRFTKVN